MIESIPFHLYLNASPIFLVTIGSLISILLATVFTKQQIPFYIVSILTLLSSLLALNLFSTHEVYWKGAFLTDSLSQLSQNLLLGTALLLILLFKESYLASRFFSGECISIFLLTILGMLVMVSSTELASLFVGLELSSIGIYVLVGYVSPSRTSLEGAIKYFILGSFATAFLLFGFGLLYATSGTMNLSELAQKSVLDNNIWLKVGILFTLVGVAFKLALVPFHSWSPDAYESAPTGITALMASSAKLIMLVLAIRISQALSLFQQDWHLIMFALAFLSMLGGNFLALIQSSLKRMLAYSSIAHSGYMTIIFCSLGKNVSFPFEALMFYLIAYTLSSLLVFGTLMWLEDVNRQNLQLSDVRGLAKTHPWAALILSVSMLSFAGMPPTVGFFGKFFVFNAALRENEYALVLIGVLGSVISLFYYLRVLVSMYMENSSKESKALNFHPSKITGLVLGTVCFAVLAFGMFPEPLFKTVQTHKDAASNP